MHVLCKFGCVVCGGGFFVTVLSVGWFVVVLSLFLCCFGGLRVAHTLLIGCCCSVVLLFGISAALLLFVCFGGCLFGFVVSGLWCFCSL